LTKHHEINQGEGNIFPVTGHQTVRAFMLSAGEATSKTILPRR